MPSTIQVLPPELADQIAAGEVVERPASVVKELAENAIDAGAARVVIEVEGGGRRLVRVVDDGCGMSPEDAVLSLKRHATSKIASVSDLFSLTTLGFRGEALPSIAAVSRFVLTTRPREAIAGTQVEVAGGVLHSTREAGCAPGTQVEVRDLLYNVPARLKFLKTEASEAAQISEAVVRLALAHPRVHFTLRHGGRSVLDLPPHQDDRERVLATLGRKDRTPPVLIEGEDGGVHVRAFLGKPEESQPTARGLYLFVNRRFVRDRSLLHALVSAHGELVERGRYPEGVVFLDVAGMDVDVNVHPQKLEVRFSRPQEIYAAVRRVVRDGVARAPWLPSPARSVDPLDVEPLRAAAPAPRAMEEAVASYFAQRPSVQASLPMAGPVGPAPPAAGRGDGPGEVAPPSPSRSSVDRSGPVPPDASGGYFSSLQYIGQLHRLYLVCQAPDELILIDQHAAHERVAFERLRAAHSSRASCAQRLLFPAVLDPGPDLVAVAEESSELLASCGFEVEAFGARSLAIKAIPDALAGSDPLPLVRDVLAELAEGAGPRSAIEGLDHLFATMACHSVTRAGDLLAVDEVRALLVSMDRIERRANCPHGRPVLLRLRMDDLARRFERA